MKKLVYYMPFRILYGHLVIKWQFGIFSTVLVCCVKKKSGNPVVKLLEINCDAMTRYPRLKMRLLNLIRIKLRLNALKTR
jgi:hypothetical protein